MDDAIRLITELGFPIAAAIGLGFFVWKLIMRIIDGMETKLDTVDDKVNAAIAQMEAKLALLGLELDHSAVEFDGLSEEGSFDIPMTRYGNIIGKSVDTPHDELDNEVKEYNLAIRFEKLDTGTYKVFGSLD